MGKISSEREHNKFQYKGIAPLGFDRFSLWFFKTIFQIPIFILLYISVISSYTYSDPIYGFFMVILIIFILLCISDLVSHVLAWWINRTIVHRWGYLLSPKKKKERLRASIQYSMYLFFRTMTFVFGIVWILSAVLFDYFRGWSFFVAWIFLSLICKALATFMTDYLVFKI